MSDEHSLAESLGKVDLGLEPENSDNDGNDERQELITLLQSYLSNTEYFPTWLKVNDVPSPTQQYPSIFATIQASLGELNAEDVGVTGSELKHNAINSLKKSCILTFLGMEIGQSSQTVDQLLHEFEKRLDGYFCKDLSIPKAYKRGFFYILRALRLHWDLHCEDLDISTQSLRHHLEHIGENFDSLTSPEKAAVLFMKASFFGEIDRSGYDRQIEIIENVISLDPDYYNWHLNLHLVLKFKRHDSGINSVPPSSREIQEIIKAASLAPENPTVIVAKCNCLAEIIRCCRDKGDFQFGSDSFPSSIEAVEYLKTKCTMATALKPTSVRVNITVAEIFSSILPLWLRDKGFAKKCIERALEFHPNSSKVNTRMGIYFLTEEQDMVQAEKYLKKAVELDGRNFPALMQLLQTYMASPETKEDVIQDIFGRQLNSNFNGHDDCSPAPHVFSSDRKATLIFQKGVFHFIREDFESAYKSWIEAYIESKSSVKFGFEKLMYHKQRFGWKHSNLEYNSILAQLTQLNEELGSDSNKKLGKELIELVEHAQNAGNQRSEGGGGRGSGFHHGVGYRRRDGAEFPIRRGRGEDWGRRRGGSGFGGQGSRGAASDDDNWRQRN